MNTSSPTPPLVTHSILVEALRELKLSEAPVAMAHASLSNIGWVVGGAQTLVEALLDALGPDGTLLVLTGWQDRPPYHQQDWEPAARHAYHAECPAFDPARAVAEGEYGRLAEAVRGWPGAAHSSHPVCAFAAVGSRAQELVADQPDAGYGPGSPLARLVEFDGRIVLLGAPLETLTVLHYAEYLANVKEKRWVTYEMPVNVAGRRRWRRFRELDSSLGALRYEDLDDSTDAFEQIGVAAMIAGIGRSAPLGASSASVFPAADLVAFAARWMESRFAG